MFLLETIKPGEATGPVAEAYSIFPPEIGVIPPLELLSASPGMLAIHTRSLRYFMSHPNLSAPLLAAIRYVSAAKSGHPFCEPFNGGLLTRMGATPDSLGKLTSEQDSVLEPREAALLAFVAKALEAPASVTQDDIEGLRARDYLDSDIYDALAHAANMVAVSVMYKTFVRE